METEVPAEARASDDPAAVIGDKVIEVMDNKGKPPEMPEGTDPAKKVYTFEEVIKVLLQFERENMMKLPPKGSVGDAEREKLELAAWRQEEELVQALYSFSEFNKQNSTAVQAEIKATEELQKETENLAATHNNILAVRYSATDVETIRWHLKATPLRSDERGSMKKTLNDFIDIGLEFMKIVHNTTEKGIETGRRTAQQMLAFRKYRETNAKQHILKASALNDQKELMRAIGIESKLLSKRLSLSKIDDAIVFEELATYTSNADRQLEALVFTCDMDYTPVFKKQCTAFYKSTNRLGVVVRSSIINWLIYNFDNLTMHCDVCGNVQNMDCFYCKHCKYLKSIEIREEMHLLQQALQIIDQDTRAVKVNTGIVSSEYPTANEVVAMTKLDMSAKDLTYSRFAVMRSRYVGHVLTPDRRTEMAELVDPRYLVYMLLQGMSLIDLSYVGKTDKVSGLRDVQRLHLYELYFKQCHLTWLPLHFCFPIEGDNAEYVPKFQGYTQRDMDRYTAMIKKLGGEHKPSQDAVDRINKRMRGKLWSETATEKTFSMIRRSTVEQPRSTVFLQLLRFLKVLQKLKLSTMESHFSKKYFKGAEDDAQIEEDTTYGMVGRTLHEFTASDLLNFFALAASQMAGMKLHAYGLIDRSLPQNLRYMGDNLVVINIDFKTAMNVEVDRKRKIDLSDGFSYDSIMELIVQHTSVAQWSFHNFFCLLYRIEEIHAEVQESKRKAITTVVMGTSCFNYFEDANGQPGVIHKLVRLTQNSPQYVKLVDGHMILVPPWTGMSYLAKKTVLILPTAENLVNYKDRFDENNPSVVKFFSDAVIVWINYESPTFVLPQDMIDDKDVMVYFYVCCPLEARENIKRYLIGAYALERMLSMYLTPNPNGPGPTDITDIDKCIGSFMMTTFLYLAPLWYAESGLDGRVLTGWYLPETERPNSYMKLARWITAYLKTVRLSGHVFTLPHSVRNEREVREIKLIPVNEVLEKTGLINDVPHMLASWVLGTQSLLELLKNPIAYMDSVPTIWGKFLMMTTSDLKNKVTQRILTYVGDKDEIDTLVIESPVTCIDMIHKVVQIFKNGVDIDSQLKGIFSVIVNLGVKSEVPFILAPAEDVQKFIEEGFQLT